MIKVESQLDTDFHRQLATSEWLSTLSSRITVAIKSHPEFHTANGAGTVRSRHNEDRYMGPLSIVKYEFVVEVEVLRHGISLVSGAKIVLLHRSGKAFAVGCSKSGTHFFKHAQVVVSPDWWRERVGGDWLECGQQK